MSECLLPSGKNNAMPIKIINFFIGKGLTPNQALGICANVYGESSYRTTPTNDESGAYGLFQWTGSRKEKLRNFCQKNGLSMNDADAQLAFAWHENDRNVWEKFTSNRSMTAMQSLDYWEDNWERCWNNTGSGKGCTESKEKCCRHSERVKELNKLVALYNENQKGGDCNAVIGSGGGTLENNVCDISSVAYSESEQPIEEKKVYFSSDHPYEPLGEGVKSTKPVFFGGTWAHYMSYYMTENEDFFSYTIDKGLLNDTSVSGKKRWCTFGGQNDFVLSDTISTSMLHHIQNYISKNNPKYIVVLPDITSIKFSPIPKTKDELTKLMTEKLTVFLQKIYCQTVIVPKLVDSWQNNFSVNGISFDYEDYNKALGVAATRAGSNFKLLVITGVNKGTERVTILPPDGFKSFAYGIKRYCKKYE